jgi:ribonucleoside-diphosphate reductase alpha chain/ribonucleoside-triphosphate reductase
MLKLSDEFISQYIDKEPPMTPLGEFVYYRTYSRFLPEKSRREYWWETVRRAVEYNCSIVETSIEEAEKLYDNIFNLRQFLSGRTLWVGGTESSLRFPMSNFNCSHVAIDSIESYCDMFYLLMLGSGVGFNVCKEYINKLPKFRNDTIVNHKPYHPVPKDKRQEDTTLEINKYFAMLTVGDSKEGWVEALKIFLHVFSINTSTSSKYRYNIRQLVINYNNIRQKGERLKTFGGISSGYENLMLMFMKIYNLLLQKKEDSFNLSSLDCLDIANMLAENVVSGGIRRSSGLCLFDINDKEVMNAKNNIFTQDINGNWILDKNLEHRTKSNNSIGFTEKPTKEKLEEIFKSIRYSGEPGFINLENAKGRFENAKGVNPCGEVLLDNRGMCNLVTVNVFGFVQDGEIQLEKLLEAFTLNVRASYRMACLDMELPEWNKVQKEHMLLGCSMTGWQDAMSTLNYSTDCQKEILRNIREVMHSEAEKYATALSRKVPKLITTVKPEGTLSLLPTVSAGVHHSYAPYYIRRVRISSGDPLVNVLEELGYNVVPEVGQDNKNCNTKVVEFYAKAPVKVTRNDISAIEQLETYKMFMDNYVDHNASNTITVKSDEWEDVIDWVYTNWDSIVGVTFLASDDSYYPLMPYEETTQEIYERNVYRQRITPELISKYEKTDIEHDIDSGGECSGGSCPIR